MAEEESVGKKKGRAPSAKYVSDSLLRGLAHS